MNKCLYDIYDDHREWFKKMLIENGAPEVITDSHVEYSAGYKASEEAFQAGYMKATEDIDEEEVNAD